MSDEKKYDKALGLDMSMGEAIERFARVTKEELAEAPPGVPAVADGELELVSFKKDSIRRVCHNGEWWYSVVDVVTALSGSERGRKYWADLKSKMIEKEGFSELSDEIGQLPMAAPDGKMRQTDVATAETVLRIIQSIASPNAEPFKRWLARVGYERIQEAQDPEVLIKRAIMHYQVQGRTDDWIEKRIRTIVSRKELTAEWKKRGVAEGKEYAALSNIIAMNTFEIPVSVHKNIKGLKAQNLRDHMTDLELIFTMLGEKSTTEIAKTRDAQGFYQNSSAAKAGGAVAGNARRSLEKETGQRVVSPKNFVGSDKRIGDTKLLTTKK